MANYTDISAIADEVLTSVRESSTKTASEATPASTLTTQIGRSLKAAAAAIRGTDEAQVTDADIAAVLSQARKYASADKTAFWPFSSSSPPKPAKPEPVFGGYASDDAYTNAYYQGMADAQRNNLPGFTMNHPDGTSDEYDADGTLRRLLTEGPLRPKTSSHRRMIRSAGTSTQLRKLAADVRAHGANMDAERAVKTAKMITAAVGLEHLTKTLRTSK